MLTGLSPAPTPPVRARGTVTGPRQGQVPALKGPQRTPLTAPPANSLEETEASKRQVGPKCLWRTSPRIGSTRGQRKPPGDPAACSGTAPLAPGMRRYLSVPSVGSREVTGRCEWWGQGPHKTCPPPTSSHPALWPCVSALPQGNL